MRGRFQALALTVAGAGSILFCWLSAAILALVTLRKGVGAGAQLLFWALLPSGVLMYAVGDSGPLMLLVGTGMMAAVLRSSVSLPLALLSSTAVGVLAGLAMLLFGGQYLDQLLAVFSEALATFEQQLSQGGGQAVEIARPTELQIAGLMGAGTAMLATLCLLLARYWQAALYNPGGFGSEFRALRYPPAVALVTVALALLLSSLGMEYRTWAVIALLPMSFAGLSLVHARVRAKGQGSTWLTFFYLAWLLLDPVKLVVMVLAVADSWFDFRRRWAGTDVAGKGD